jgi:hypothetical protein
MNLPDFAKMYGLKSCPPPIRADSDRNARDVKGRDLRRKTQIIVPVLLKVATCNVES